MDTKIKIKNSISTKLLKLVFSFYLIIAIVITLIHMIAEYNRTEQSIIEGLQLFHSMFQPGLANALYNLEHDVAQEIIEGILQIKRVTGVKLVDATQEQVGSCGDVTITQGAFHRTFPISLEGDQVGHLTLYSSRSVVFQEVKLGFVFIIVNSIIKTLALLIIFHYFSRILLSRPLAKMTLVANEVQMDNLEHLKLNIKTPGRNELKILEEALNAMIQKLLMAREKLKDNAEQMRMYQISLESLVAERTEKLAGSNLQLQETLDHLQNAQQQLIESEKMASLGGLVAGIAHEINTPIGVSLTGITYIQQKMQTLTDNLHSQTLKKTELEEGFNDMLAMSDSMHTCLEKAVRLVRSFKQVAVDQHYEVAHTFNFHDIISNILLSLRHQCDKHNVQTENCVDAALRICSFPGIFSQIFTNLITNSLIHGFPDKQQGHIRIHATCCDHTLMLTYEDDGMGMEGDIISKIFDPFFTTKRGQGGSGLGLHIVYNLITQKLNGSITCASEVSKGVTFTIEIPNPDEKCILTE